jgi:thiamine-phosphate pyrophosphorylase
MAVADARRLLGPHAIIGFSIKSVTEAETAPVELIDYVGSGGVYTTLSKAQKKPPIGPQGLARIIDVLKRRKQEMPVCGIAGVDASNAAEVIAAGADGVAVISALSLVPDPAAAARTLRGIVDATLAKRGG